MIAEAGVLADSERYYLEASDFARTNLFTVPHAGRYHCSCEYVFSRASLDVCQLLFVEAGTLVVEYLGQTYHAGAGSVVILDCRTPHHYYVSSDNLKMQWFHFVGNASAAYTKMLTDTLGVVFTMDYNAEAEDCLKQIFTAMQQSRPDEHALSITLHRLLAILATATERTKSEIEIVIDDLCAYIDAHYNENIAIPDLARKGCISTCYLLRKFKEVKGQTPYQYILNARIRVSKELLSTTYQSIERIGEQCGFSNTSHFVMTFRKKTGMTPLQFRTLWP